MKAKAAIQESGLTVAQLARDSGLSEAAIWAWLQDTRKPSPESLQRLVGGLEKRSDYLRELAAELRRAAGE